MSTERTILSPFTKEYRVLAALSGIRLFLEGCSLLNRPINISLISQLGIESTVFGSRPVNLFALAIPTSLWFLITANEV